MAGKGNESASNTAAAPNGPPTDNAADKKDEPLKPPTGTSGIGDFEVEFVNAKNRPIMFQPTMEKYRSAWLRQNLNGDEMSEAISKMPDLPGIRVLVSATTGRALIYDPLSLPENADLLARAQRVCKVEFGVECGPMKQVDYNNMDATKIKTWVYWLRRLLDNNHARVTKGFAPSAEVIEKLPGKTRGGVWDSSAHSFKFREMADEYFQAILSGTHIRQTANA